MGYGARISDPRSLWRVWRSVQATGHGNGDQRSPHSPSVAVAKWPCRALDRVNSKRVPGPPNRLQPGVPAPRAPGLCQLLQRYPHAPIPRQRRPARSSSSKGRSAQIYSSPRRSAPILDPDPIFGRDSGFRDSGRSHLRAQRLATRFTGRRKPDRCRPSSSSNPPPARLLSCGSNPRPARPSSMFTYTASAGAGRRTACSSFATRRKVYSMRTMAMRPFRFRSKTPTRLSIRPALPCAQSRGERRSSYRRLPPASIARTHGSSGISLQLGPMHGCGYGRLPTIA